MKNFTIFNSKIFVFLLIAMACISLGDTTEVKLVYATVILPFYYLYCWILHSIVDDIDYEVNVNKYGLKILCSFIPFSYAILFNSFIVISIVIIVSQIVLVILGTAIVKKYTKILNK